MGKRYPDFEKLAQVTQHYLQGFSIKVLMSQQMQTISVVFCVSGSVALMIPDTVIPSI